MAIDGEQRREFRRTRAKRETPTAVAWAGSAVAGLSVLSGLFGDMSPTTLLAHFGVAAVLWVTSAVMAHPRVPARAIPTLAALCSVIVVAQFQAELWRDPTALGMAYVLLVMLAFGPFTLSPWAMLGAGIPALAGCILTASRAAEVLAPALPLDWVIAGVAALVIGALLLRLRLLSIDELGEMTLLAQARAIRDPLTGVLNRHGLDEHLPEIVAMAAREQADVFAAFVDIDGLKAVNDTYGHEIGDEVITVVAAAVRDAVRSGDLVARWGGDEFLVFGVGPGRQIDEFARRLEGSIRASGFGLSKWSGGVSIGMATASAGALDFDDLIARADAQMYERRKERRG